MKADEFLKVTPAALRTTFASSDPWSASPIGDERGLRAAASELSPMQVEYVLASYYEARRSAPLDVLGVFLASDSRIIRMNAMQALKQHSVLPTGIQQLVKRLRNAPSTAMEKCLADEIVSRFCSDDESEDVQSC